MMKPTSETTEWWNTADDFDTGVFLNLCVAAHHEGVSVSAINHKANQSDMLGNCVVIYSYTLLSGKLLC